ncbi:MAG: 50S ribosome-binding GTPase [Gemmataceae bacterium]|nr:50S ribosome-binding GTPase [Gemmataceae bacterium]
MVEPVGAPARSRTARRARAARLTPAGTAGVATIAVAGPDAWAVVSPLFRRANGKSLIDAPAPGKLHYGTFGTAPGDQVVLSARPDPPEPWYEIHCHGGMQIVAWLLEQIHEQGAEVVTWQTLYHGPVETIRSLAEDALTRATTLRTANILLDQAQGACERVLRRVLELFDQSRVNAAVQALDRLLRWTLLGRHLTRPWRVAVCGPVNAGKSSLINAIAGYERAVVSPIPGTTRDVVSTHLALDGWPVELLDTAGRRHADSALEAEGIRLGEQQAESADLVLWVMDATGRPGNPPGNALVVINKIDLGLSWDPADVGAAQLVSAATGAGIDHLIEVISRRLVSDPPSPGDAVPFCSSLIDALQSARAAVAQGRAGTARAIVAELLQPS